MPTETPKDPKAVLVNRIVAGAIVAILGLFGWWGASQIWENVEADEIVVIQAPFSGELKFYTDPGTVWQNFGTVTTYKRRSMLEFDCKESKAERIKTEKIDGKDVVTRYMASVYSGGSDIRFNDGGHGTICGSLQYEMPSDHEQLKKLYQRFKGQAAVEGLLKKQTDSAIYLAGQLMSSKESYNETRNDLIHYISDQIQNGVYRTRTKTVSVNDPITQQQKLVSAAEIVLDRDGQAQRQELSALHEFGVKIFNFTISRLPYDDQVEAQIQQQQRLTMDVQTSVAELKKAEQRNATVEQQGRANATEEKWKQEAIKAQKVVEAQQTKEVAETGAKQKLEVAKLEKEAAEQNKQRDILKGEGEATAKRLIIEADGALQAKLDAFVQTQANWATAFSSYTGAIVPQFMLGGGTGATGSGTGLTNFMDIMSMQAAKALALDMTIRSGSGTQQPAQSPVRIPGR